MPYYVNGFGKAGSMDEPNRQLPKVPVGAFSGRIRLPPAVTGWAASCGWALVFLSKGAGAGPIATQLGPVCAQTYVTPARGKFFWQAES